MMTTKFIELSLDTKKEHAKALLDNPAFQYFIDREMKTWLESFEGCKPEEVQKRDYCFAKYKAAKDLKRMAEMLLTKPPKKTIMEIING